MTLRSATLQEWEASRLNEVWIDLLAFRWRCAKPFALLFSLFALGEYTGIMNRTIQFGFLLCALLAVGGAITVWLRLWGAFIERRLIEIEAIVAGIEPTYYRDGDQVQYDRNPLYIRLHDIERALSRVSTEHRAAPPPATSELQ